MGFFYWVIFKERRRWKKLIWLARIDQSLSDPNGIVGYVLPEIIFGQGHPYAKPSGGSGTRESIQWMSRDDMVKYHQGSVNPSNATLLVVGDTTLDEIVKDLDEREITDCKIIIDPSKSWN